MLNKLKFLNLIVVCFLIGSCTDLSYQAVDSTVVTPGADGSVGKASDLITTLYAQLGRIQDSQNDTWTLSEMVSDEQLGPTRGTDWSDNGQLRSLHTHTSVSYTHLHDVLPCVIKLLGHSHKIIADINSFYIWKFIQGRC